MFTTKTKVTKNKLILININININRFIIWIFAINSLVKLCDNLEIETMKIIGITFSSNLFIFYFQIKKYIYILILNFSIIISGWFEEYQCGNSNPSRAITSHEYQT